MTQTLDSSVETADPALFLSALDISDTAEELTNFPVAGRYTVDLTSDTPRVDASLGLATPVVSLAVVMPVYNEERTVRQAIEEVLALDLPCPLELIVVDDGSRDGTAELIASIDDPRLVPIRHQTNRGKGAALRTGAAAATASHIVPFDADLEYSAGDLARLIEPVVAGRADIVYGTRVSHGRVNHRYGLYALGNSVMTGLANLLYRSAITDLHTCLKLMPLAVMRSLPLTQDGFGLDTEMTAWLLRFRLPVCEVSVSYEGRTRAEGKKIGWRDGLNCLHVLGSVRVARSVRPPAAELAPMAPARPTPHLQPS
jgi:dolichol-phosphate hexosyltransferase